jgi:hypothetical protein
VPLSGPAPDLLRGLLPEDATAANHAMGERRASGAMALPGLLGTPFAGWSKAKAALDKATVEARKKAAKETGTIPASIVPWSIHDLRRTVATESVVQADSAGPRTADHMAPSHGRRRAA